VNVRGNRLEVEVVIDETVHGAVGCNLYTGPFELIACSRFRQGLDTYMFPLRTATVITSTGSRHLANADQDSGAECRRPDTHTASSCPAPIRECNRSAPSMTRTVALGGCYGVAGILSEEGPALRRVLFLWGR